MADYYTPTVIEPLIPITSILPIERLFLSHVFDEEIDGETIYYFSDKGAKDLIYMPIDKLREALEHSKQSQCRLAERLLESYSDAICGEDDFELDNCGDIWTDVLQDIVRRSSDLDHLTVTMAFTCSKMRPDGFGGFAMLITAETIRWESTNTRFDRFYKEASANGEISHGHT